MAYSAHQVAALAGISKNTLLRWLKQGKVSEVFRDRNGWRVFQETDVERICSYAHTMSPPTGSTPTHDAGSSCGSEAA
jgi:predicted site-specific integrase-resolvase